MRNLFSSTITKIAKDNSDVVLLTGDIGNKLFNNFKEANPNQFYNCGIAEANMASVASGMASMGMRPFCYTITPFLIYRAYEQIRVDVSYHNFPVVFVGTGSGLSYAQLGSTHHSLEDIGVMRLLPNFDIINPADPEELEMALYAVMESSRPTFIRIAKKGEKIFNYDKNNFSIGKIIPVIKGKDVLIISTGSIISNVLNVIDSLNDMKVYPSLVSMHTIKPIDEDFILEAVLSYKCIVTIEEHSVIGGLGSSVNDVICSQPIIKGGISILNIGTKDKYIDGVGDREWYLDKHDMSNDKIVLRIINAISNVK